MTQATKFDKATFSMALNALMTKGSFDDLDTSDHQAEYKAAAQVAAMLVLQSETEMGASKKAIKADRQRCQKAVARTEGAMKEVGEGHPSYSALKEHFTQLKALESGLKEAESSLSFTNQAQAIQRLANNESVNFHKESEIVKSVLQEKPGDLVKTGMAAAAATALISGTAAALSGDANIDVETFDAGNDLDPDSVLAAISTPMDPAELPEGYAEEFAENGMGNITNTELASNISAHSVALAELNTFGLGAGEHEFLVASQELPVSTGETEAEAAADTPGDEVEDLDDETSADEVVAGAPETEAEAAPQIRDSGIRVEVADGTPNAAFRALQAHPDFSMTDMANNGHTFTATWQGVDADGNPCTYTQTYMIEFAQQMTPELEAAGQVDHTPEGCNNGCSATAERPSDALNDAALADLLGGKPTPPADDFVDTPADKNPIVPDQIELGNAAEMTHDAFLASCEISELKEMNRVIAVPDGNGGMVLQQVDSFSDVREYMRDNDGRSHVLAYFLNDNGEFRVVHPADPHYENARMAAEMDEFLNADGEYNREWNSSQILYLSEAFSPDEIPDPGTPEFDAFMAEYASPELQSQHDLMVLDNVIRQASDGEFESTFDMVDEIHERMRTDDRVPEEIKQLLAIEDEMIANEAKNPDLEYENRDAQIMRYIITETEYGAEYAAAFEAVGMDMPAYAQLENFFTNYRTNANDWTFFFRECAHPIEQIGKGGLAAYGVGSLIGGGGGAALVDAPGVPVFGL